jgi:hypothetical protein
MSAPLCKHETFEAVVQVVRLNDVDRHIAEIQVRCQDCGVRFRWLGFERGLHPTEPRVSIDEFELRAPITPDGHLTSLMAGPDTGFPAIKMTRRE